MVVTGAVVVLVVELVTGAVTLVVTVGDTVVVAVVGVAVELVDVDVVAASTVCPDKDVNTNAEIIVVPNFIHFLLVNISITLFLILKTDIRTLFLYIPI
ncbi:hypothetical protein FC68_GL002187 [Companilactobacillus farciminis KCTC 3681 = DSM 20184]|nr:hypothetical protein FC68_GL002187 [Companilactobacillus farciminis KCTC 3681 = DSM 20184]